MLKELLEIGFTPCEPKKNQYTVTTVVKMYDGGHATNEVTTANQQLVLGYINTLSKLKGISSLWDRIMFKNITGLNDGDYNTIEQFLPEDAYSLQKVSVEFTDSNDEHYVFNVFGKGVK